MAGGVGDGSVLAPTGRATNYQFGVKAEKRFWCKTSPLQHAWAEALNHNIGLLAEPFDRCQSFRRFSNPPRRWGGCG